MSTSSWYNWAIFYEAPVRAFKDSNGDGLGDLIGLTQKLDYLAELGIDCIWINPIFPSPLKDDGYDISDFYGVHPDYGSLDDFKTLLEAVHARGLRLITDLVVNHTSNQHPWFQAARQNRTSPYRDYYVWSDSNERYQDARIIFVDSEESNWTWDEVAGQYYWHWFYAHQPDLNYRNPAVQAEMLEIMRFWLDLGVDGFRVDAVPYLFEREGTSCENLPETHEYLKVMRRFVDQYYTGRVLLCEANQWPQDVIEYFGNGDEFHMAFHFPLMPRIYIALRQGNASPIRWVMEHTPDIPPGTQWCTFLRNHDELTLEMVTEEERQWMWQEYAPESRMRLNLGIRRRLAPLLNNDQRLIKLAYSLLYTLPGAPIVYYGDEIGMGDNIWLPDRNGVRTPMQWDSSPSAGFSLATQLYSPVIDQEPYDYKQVNVAAQKADPDSLYQAIHRMITVRKAHPALMDGDIEWVDGGTNAILAFYRTTAGERLLLIHNLSNEIQQLELITANMPLLVDLFSGEEVQLGGNRQTLSLEPHEYRWMKAR